MELRQLRYFIMTADLLNYTKAAEFLYVSQPALSHSISNLEWELGVKLFERDKRIVRLTQAGKIFLADAKKIMSIVEESAIRVKRANIDCIGTLRIGFLPAFVFRKHLPQWVSDFHTKYPCIDLSMHQYNSTLLYEALENGELDIGFCISTDLHDSKSLCSGPILQDRLALIMKKSHPMAKKETVRLEELADYPFVMLSKQESSGFYKRVMQVCHDRGFVPNVVKMSNQLESVMMMVSAGIGVTILPGSSRLDDNQELRYINIEGDNAGIDILIAWNKDNTNPMIEIMLNFLMEAVKREYPGSVQYAVNKEQS